MKTQAKAKAKGSTKKAAITEHDGKPIAGDKDQSILFVLDVGRDLLVVRANTYKGRKSLDIRRFWDTGKEWAPSGKGVSVPEDKVGDFLEALRDPTVFRTLVMKEGE